MTTTSPAQDAAAVMDLLTGGWVAQAVRAVAELNIADHLAAGATTADEVASREGSDPRATYRLMRAAASLGLLSFGAETGFGLTRQGQMLRSGVPGSMRSLVLIQNSQGHWRTWERFPDAVREGRSQVRKALGADLFEYFALAENAEEAALFARAMGDLSGLVTQAAVAVVDTTGVATAVDVGGADGDLVLGLMTGNPALRGQVLELPHAVEGARARAEQLGLSERFDAVAGDFFAEVPAAELYLLKMIMHDWDDEQCLTILRNCRASAAPGARALVVEMVVGGVGSRDFATRVDMNMLSITQGLERDLEEYDTLFTASGWRRERVFPVGAGYSVQELVAV